MQIGNNPAKPKALIARARTMVWTLMINLVVAMKLVVLKQMSVIDSTRLMALYASKRCSVRRRSLTSSTAPGVTHRFTNLRAFAEEVASARIWAGFHYRFSTRVGTEMGRRIGHYVALNVMQPVAMVDLR